METVEDLFRFIDTLPFEEAELNDIKFLLLAQKFDQFPEQFSTHRDLADLEKNLRHELDLLRKDMKSMKLEITVTLGVIVVASIAALGTLMKLL